MIPLKIADMAVAACNEEIAKLQAKNARLKAEVNELADGLKLASEVGIKIADEVTRLKSEVERLRIAGTYLCSTMEVNGIHDNGDIQMHERAIALWHAAKEGKQS